MSKELINSEDTGKFGGLALAPEYKGMLDIVVQAEKGILNATAQHSKSHSQFQYALLDCSGPIAGLTKLRNWRQVLAVIDRTKDALEESSRTIRQNVIQLRILDKKYSAEQDPDQLALLTIEMDKIEYQTERTKYAMSGAIRKLATYVLHFKELERQIREELNKAPDEPITEEEFERDEERFHIIKAFQQGLQAARTFGKIDHGNMIYLDDIGISGSLAQTDVTEYLRAEERYRSLNPTYVHEIHALEREFLFSMAKKYAGCGLQMTTAKGLRTGILDEVVLKLN